MKIARFSRRRCAPALLLWSACTMHGDRGAPATAAQLEPGQSAAPSTDMFAPLMHEAMAKMDRDMAVECTGDADRDFAAMMIPHHQGAVDMALLELRFGKDERLRRLAQGIIVEQRQEIALMRDIVGAP